MNRTSFIPLVIAALLLPACHRPVHVEPPEVPIRPHAPAPDVPVRPHVPADVGPGEAISQAEVRARMQDLAGSYGKQTISAACEINSGYTVFTGDWEDKITEAAGKLGVPNLALRKLVLSLQRGEVSRDEVLGAAVEQLCYWAAGAG